MPGRALTESRSAGQPDGCRGVVLVLALFAVLIAVTLSASFLTAQSTTLGIARNVQNYAQARQVAESGMELAVAYVRSNPTWRSDRPNGTWVSAQTFGPGTFSVTGVDGVDSDGDGVVDGDGSLSDDSADPVTLTVVGTVGGTTHVVRGVLTPPDFAHFGFDVAFAGQQNNVKHLQIATRVNLPVNGTVMALSAYVKGPPPKDLRMAIYTDSAGEPASRIVQTDLQPIGSNVFYWHTLSVTPTALAAGDYWLAICFEHDTQYYAYNSTGGQTRYSNNNAMTGGFSAAWGTSSTSNTRQINIYANYTPEEGSASDDYQFGWQEQP